MAENLSIKKSPIDSVLECPLCLHQLNLPQTLQQCLHSYCKSCLDKVPQKTQDGQQGWMCPMCDNFTKCDQIQQNTFIEELQKIHLEPEHSGINKCEQCFDDCAEATWKCVECKIGLCEIGKAVHLKIPMLKGHTILPLNSDGEKLIDNIIYCKVHKGIPAQLNCRDCEHLICSTGNTTDHQGHRAETVDQALERMLPATESNARQVNKNIKIMETQIEGVKKEIVQTKESYASIRMQMDDHLEKVICRMRALKAQMEEDVNEQESIALDTLNEFNQQLEKQLSQARIISNLTAVVTTKTRHTSQLQQLQTGLFQKVKSAGELKTQSLSFFLPTSHFVEGQRFLEEIDKVFGKLDFVMKEQIIDISGESYKKTNQFLCSDFNQIAKSQFEKEKENVVNVDWCNRLSCIDNNICLPLRCKNKINIYDEDGELKHEIDTGDKSIVVVKTAYNGDVICAGLNGLFVTDTQFKKWTMLSEGKFSDVVVEKDKFIALQYDLPSVCTYSRVMTGDNGQEPSWRECHSFMLTNDVKINHNSIICTVAEQYLLISSSSTDAKGLFKLTYGGEYLDRCNDLPFSPIICGTDQKKHVLVADFGKGAMYLFKPLSEKEIQRTAKLSDVQTPQVRSVVIDKNNNFWVLSGLKNTFKVIKFASQL